MRNLLLTFMILQGISYADAQVINGPVVSGRFEQIYLQENFDSVSTDWPVTSNSDNLLLIQDGELIIHRRSPSAPFAAMGNMDNALSDYRLITSLKLTKAGEDGSIGFIFMAQTGGNGGFIFELNARQQYRIRQITGTVYRFMTGDIKSGGWVKNSLVNETGNANLLEIRTGNRKYDIYLNNRYLLSFSEMAYRSGGFGYFAGPSSRGTVDFLYIFRGESADQPVAAEKVPSATGNEDIVVLTETIVRLNNQAKVITAENEELRRLLKLQKSETEETQLDKSDMKNQLEELQRKMAAMRLSYDSLIQANNELMRYKTASESQADGEVLITLSKSLKAEKQRNEELHRENLRLKSELDKIRKTAPVSN